MDVGYDGVWSQQVIWDMRSGVRYNNLYVLLILNNQKINISNSNYKNFSVDFL